MVTTSSKKVIRFCFGFALLRSVISLKKLASLSQPIESTVIPQPIVTRSRTFSCASCRLHVLASSFDWLTGLSVSSVIGQSDYFGFGFTKADIQ